MDQQEIFSDYQLVLQQFEQRQSDLIKNCPPEYIQQLLPYVEIIEKYFRQIPKIESLEQQLFFIDLIFAYTRCYEIYNKNQYNQHIYQNRYNITNDIKKRSKHLQKIWSLEKKIQQYNDYVQIGRLKEKLSKNLQTLRVITQNDQLTIQKICEQVDNTKYYIFNYDIGLAGCSSYDGTRVYVHVEQLKDPLETLCHEISHNITRYLQQIDCRGISPQKNPQLQINGKMVEAGFYFEHYALNVKLEEYQLDPFTLKQTI